ncbi:hypothetical protein YPPY13_2740 [Yersinia pestis PY-13]|uniref:Uncharacterized protein n=2 Tax=Yersinia pestis TaxID=632 RepID=A0AAV3BGZ1_YERPE|nr:hypothetical protein YPIP275_2716 [Yersinia pestis biovar Orientalis str. IP275]EIQ87792.1 hypothetical protein YPPY01_2653 [Yersinia pestis PY-01]EIQ89182.1 hypothetical protein YPPY02_2692 [Yersinia pestis PY-02]EIR01452.1 hypothetical protein YPPY04_2718 [Yersinia pestis PY-04]EIR02961.1 hypothetical protein YPPY05_2689 [Yersinia pestis PY-05]EIR16984.1 hypothetical protein YPPY07_2615 [Yersinia pestis PY-07]EIR17810.1 hypothetical protein YPPY08_2731 [Yersinia pestis PY-08]EIR19789.1 
MGKYSDTGRADRSDLRHSAILRAMPGAQKNADVFQHRHRNN